MKDSLRLWEETVKLRNPMKYGNEAGTNNSQRKPPVSMISVSDALLQREGEESAVEAGKGWQREGQRERRKRTR